MAYSWHPVVSNCNFPQSAHRTRTQDWEWRRKGLSAALFFQNVSSYLLCCSKTDLEPGDPSQPTHPWPPTHQQVCVPLLHFCLLLSGDVGSKPWQTPIRRESSFHIKGINGLTCIWPGAYTLPAPCNMTDMSNRNLLNVSFVTGQLRAKASYSLKYGGLYLM